ncbi:BCS1 N terminal-domain-containing protein [Aspergillus undulatus]|uniref:BCS1 N terminal-domain-containing protein n=1 Tax=Aspergillus undulatus TaxID=1810928 RepID=UPI003CCDFFDD
MRASVIQPFLDLLRNTLHVEPLVFVNIGLIIIAIITSLRSAGNTLYSYAEKTCLTTVHVKGDDALYDDSVRWMNNHAFQHRNFLSVLAQITNDSDKNRHLVGSQLAGLKSDTLISYREVDDLSSIELKPFHGTRFFCSKGTWIYFSHTTNSSESTSRSPQVEGNPKLTLQCLSLSLSPLKSFLDEVRAYARKVSVSKITVYRTSPNTRDVVRWKSVASRPSRDISTIFLDKQWYANHGIPYRRGYLFSGPPGTGKTSLASTIAGVFGQDIYVLSLQYPTMTEPQFIRLFSEVPTRCMVPLEDVDAARLNRSDMVAASGKVSSKLAQSTPASASASTSAISLSALLNAIDDRALIRPGRVDLHIRFGLPSREELRYLFLSIYNDTNPRNQLGTGQEKQEKLQVESETLNELAWRFSRDLPEGRFSAAEVQGFLLRYKRQPEGACGNVTSWVEEMDIGY